MQKIIPLLLLLPLLAESTPWDEARQNFRDLVREARAEQGLERGVSLDRKIVDRLFERVFQGVDERALDREQVQDATGSGLPIVGSEFGTRLKNELVQRGRAEDVDGFFALDQALFLVPRTEEFIPEQTRVIKSALAHPALSEGLKQEIGLRVFDLVGRMGSEPVDEVYPTLLRAMERIPEELSDKSVFKLSAMFLSDVGQARRTEDPRAVSPSDSVCSRTWHASEGASTRRTRNSSSAWDSMSAA